MNLFLLFFQTWLTRSVSPSLPCNWPRWCGRGSRPSPRTSSCSSSLDLRQSWQEGQGQPAEQTLCRDAQTPKLIISWHHVGAGRTYRLHPPLDGQQVRHPVVEPRSKTVRIDRHETLTLRAQHRWWRHAEPTHYGRLRGRRCDVMFTRLTHWPTLSF